MKSRLLKSIDLTQEATQKRLTADFSLALKLPPDAQKVVAAEIVNLASKRTRAEQKPIVAKLESVTKLSVPELNRVISVMGLFLTAFNDEDFAADTPEAWADDLQDNGVIDAGERGKLLDLLAHLRSNVSSDILQLGQEKGTAIGVFPFLNGVTATVEVRAVLEKRFEPGTDVSDYQPKVVRAVPVISIAISADSGNPGTFTIQADPQGVQLFIDELEAALKTVHAIKNSIKEMTVTTD
jgi:hypothetical protein